MICNYRAEFLVCLMRFDMPKFISRHAWHVGDFGTLNFQTFEFSELALPLSV